MTGTTRGGTISNDEPEKHFPTNLKSFSIGAKLGIFFLFDFSFLIVWIHFFCLYTIYFDKINYCTFCVKASSHFDGSIFLLTKRADIAEEKLYVTRKIDAEKLSTKDMILIQV